jgi:cystathionine beta-synthase
MFSESILDAIGNTPLVRLRRVVPQGAATLVAKCEFLNPAGSIKDRMALYIIEKAERTGKLQPGGVIVENTSGNTGLGVAMAAAVKGYRCVFTIPDKMSTEKINMLKAFGAEVVVTPTNVPADSPESYYETARRIARETPGAFYLNQYDNLDNIEAHYKSTGPEIWRQTEGRLDAFVAGIGTGGTMSGAGRFLKEQKPELRTVAVDAVGSVYKQLFETGSLSEPKVYKVEGIGEDRVCQAMDFSVVDEVRQVNDREAFHMARRLTREEGLFAGGSSGSAVHVAVDVARELGPGHIVVVVLPDSGTRYITKYFSDEWMRDNGFFQPLPDATSTIGEIFPNLRRPIVGHPHEAANQIAARMKKGGFSQLPIVDPDGRAIGMVHEVDLLSALVEGKIRHPDPIEAVVQPLEGRVTLATGMRQLMEIFNAGNVAVVVEGGAPVAVITKMDLIDRLTRSENPPIE